MSKNTNATCTSEGNIQHPARPNNLAKATVDVSRTLSSWNQKRSSWQHPLESAQPCKFHPRPLPTSTALPSWRTVARPHHPYSRFESRRRVRQHRDPNMSPPERQQPCSAIWGPKHQSAIPVSRMRPTQGTSLNKSVLAWSYCAIVVAMPIAI